MTRLLCAALVVLAAPLATAQDAWRWDATRERKPEKGYRHVTESDGSEKKKLVARIGAKVVGKEESESKTVTRYVHEILEVADGKVTKARIKVEKWSRASGGDEAEHSLEGQTILVEGRGASIKWTCEDAKAELSDGAKEWIDQTLAPKDDAANEEAFKSLLPDKPIATGDEWTRDPARFAKVFLGPDLAIDAEKSTAKGKLGEVKTEDGVHVGRFTLEVVLVSKAEKEDEAVRVVFSVAFDGSLEPDKRDSSTMTMTVKAKGKQRQETDEGVALIDIDNVITAKETERPAADATPKK
ncbi:MAG: hypothetical protein ACAI25_09995 [Planctomycetota bacterium]